MSSAGERATAIELVRKSINENVHESTLHRAAEGKPDAEERIAEVVLDTLEHWGWLTLRRSDG